MAFYLTLPSTASIGIYPDNTQSDYTTQLAQSVELQGQWEVGLSEVHIPVSWYNVDSSNDTFAVKYETVRKEERTSMRELPPLDDVKVTLPKRVYNGRFIYRVLRDSLPPGAKENIHFKYEEEKTVIVTFENGYGIRFPKEAKTFANTIFGLQDNYLERNLYGSFSSEIPRTLTASGPRIPVTDDSYTLYVLQPTPLEEFTEVVDIVETSMPLVHIHHGRYDNAVSLFEEMRIAIPSNVRHLFRFLLLPNGKTYVFAKGTGRVMFPKKHPGLGEMLGFDHLETWFEESTSRYAMDLKRGIDGLYIYSDLILPQLVGDAHGELLRVINPSVRTRNEESIVNIYERPDYYPLARNVFESIRIFMRTDSGELLSFKYGKVVVKLHFRRRHESEVHDP